LSDVSGEISKIFGVPVKQGGSVVKEFEGNEITLIRAFTHARWTFILDKNSKIVFKNTDVDAENDINSVVDFLNKL
jgi:peroxiredoxin Q/BCP